MIDRDQAREPVLAQGLCPDEPRAGVAAEQRRQHLRTARRLRADQHVDRGAIQIQDAERCGERHIGRAALADQADRTLPRTREQARDPAHTVEVAATVAAEIDHQPHRRTGRVRGHGIGDLAVGGPAETVQHHDQSRVAPPFHGGDRGLRVRPADGIGIGVVHPNQASRRQAASNETSGAAGAGGRAAALDF